MSRKKDIQYITGKNKKGGQEYDKFLEQYNIVDKEKDQNGLDDEIEEYLDNDTSVRLLHNINDEISKQHKKKQIKVGSFVFAASLFFAFLYHYSKISTHTNEFVYAAPASMNKSVEQKNETKFIRQIKLPDNTVVDLYPNSTIVYQAQFENDKRDIFLSGKATFNVSKDARRPFTVYSENIATIALGTKFKVYKSKELISVDLYEGKVLVRKVHQTKNDKQYYLTPGNVICYNIKKDIFTSNFEVEAKLDNRRIRPIIKEKNTEDISKNTIPLDNIAMSDALDILAEKFDAEIEYSPKDVEHINIITTVTHKQSLETVLHNIAIMNNLELIKVNKKRYILTHK